MSRSLTYATVCSGIECMSVAARGLPLRPVFFSEIEPFPCAVLKAHYPDVPNLGDMSKIKVLRPAAPAAVSPENPMEITNGTTNILLDSRLDILAGGTPCQDVSVAGKRAGMQEGSGTRSSLAFDFVRLARELGPRFVIWENVAGAIDSKNAPDFLAFLRALGDCGYSLAWRVLDAQYVRVDGMERAVPQRRRRVWVVGCLGADKSTPAQILFEPDCVAGHTAPRRRTGQGFAYSLARRDRVDAGVVGEPAARGFRSGSFGQFVNDETCGTLDCEHMTSAANGTPAFAVHDAIALDGDKLKPRTDQRKGGNGFGVNEEGAGYTLTGVDRHGVAYDMQRIGQFGNGETASTVKSRDAKDYTDLVVHSGQDNRANAVVQCYENHAQDSRINPIEVSDTRNQKDGTGGNNLPLVCFSKVSHPHAPNGEGERWDEREVAQTRNTFDNGEKRCQEVVVSTAYKLDSIASNSMKSANPHSGFHETQVAACLDTTTPDPSKGQGGNVIISTNSNGEDVAPTISSCEYKMGQKQKDTGGGYVLTRREEGANDEPQL